MKYNYTQVGYLTIFALFFTATIFWFLLRETPIIYREISIFMLVILAVLFSFLWLKVSVDEEYLRIKFGYGLYRKKFKLDEIVSVKVVKNHWYYGWGIRVWFWPYMWIYNISGFDAVEIKMKNGKIFRIGTDEPEILKETIEDSIKIDKL